MLVSGPPRIKISKLGYYDVIVVIGVGVWQVDLLS
jgi:hypothetical protein